MKELLSDPAFLQWSGCGFGLLGSLLLATRGPFAGWGFAAYILSNLFWICYGHLTNAPGIVVMQLGFGVTSTIGVWKWLVAPAMVGRRSVSDSLQMVDLQAAAFRGQMIGSKSERTA